MDVYWFAFVLRRVSVCALLKIITFSYSLYFIGLYGKFVNHRVMLKEGRQDSCDRDIRRSIRWSKVEFQLIIATRASVLRSSRF
jgi:phosphoenolpyruvate carboxylase